MSKYNNYLSIPVNNIPKEELAQAIHEWAEGSEAMERLLWSCYNHGIETSGCHAEQDPYLGFYLNDNLDNISRVLNVTQKAPRFQILLSPDGGNPFSGPNWDKADVTIGVYEKKPEKVEAFLDTITDALDNQTNGENNPLIQLVDYFKEKNSLLKFRLRNLDDNCIFSIEMAPASKELSDFYQDLFTRAGLERSVISPEHEANGRYSWKLVDKNLDMLYMKIDQAKEIIEEGYPLKPELKEDDLISFSAKARYMKQKLPEEQFNTWMGEKRKERDEAKKR